MRPSILKNLQKKIKGKTRQVAIVSMKFDGSDLKKYFADLSNY